MMTIKHLSISIILIATLLMVHTAQATTYYVDRQLPGSDSSNGTGESTPFLSINRCVTVINGSGSPGDTCLVKNGNYPEPWTLTRSGASGNPITIKNYPGHAPTITMTGMSNAGNQVQIGFGSGAVPVSYINLEGFEVSNAYFGVQLRNVDHVNVSRMTIHDTTQGFIGNGFHVTFDRNRVYHVGEFAACAAAVSSPWIPCSHDHGWYFGGTFITLTNNLIYGNLGYGVQAAGYPYVAGNQTSVVYAGVDHWNVYNNTFAWSQNRGGIILWNPGGGVTNVNVKNNIFYHNGQTTLCTAMSCGSGVDVSAASTTIVITNNVFYSAAPSSTVFINPPGGNGVNYSASGNSTTTNPKMVNAPATMPASPDFHLMSGSVAIDFGLNLYSIGVISDHAGAARPTSGPFGAGGYEGAGESGASPSPPIGLKVF
jgi:hypothetical protein